MLAKHWLLAAAAHGHKELLSCCKMHQTEAELGQREVGSFRSAEYFSLAGSWLEVYTVSDIGDHAPPDFATCKLMVPY